MQQSLKFSTVILDPHPIGDVKTISDVQAKLAERAASDGKGPGDWIIGWGYDDTGLAEQRHPTRQDLDAVSTDRPIVLMHISSHLMTANTDGTGSRRHHCRDPEPLRWRDPKGGRRSDAERCAGRERDGRDAGCGAAAKRGARP